MPDHGLFGPESVTWRVNRESVLLLGGGRALLLQVAHPSVAAGVAQGGAVAAHVPHRRPAVLVEVAAGVAAEAGVHPHGLAGAQGDVGEVVDVVVGVAEGPAVEVLRAVAHVGDRDPLVVQGAVGAGTPVGVVDVAEDDGGVLRAPLVVVVGGVLPAPLVVVVGGVLPAALVVVGSGVLRAPLVVVGSERRQRGGGDDRAGGENDGDEARGGTGHVVPFRVRVVLTF